MLETFQRIVWKANPEVHHDRQAALHCVRSIPKLLPCYPASEMHPGVRLEDKSHSTVVVDTEFKLQTMENRQSALDYHFTDHICNHTAIMKALRLMCNLPAL